MIRTIQFLTIGLALITAQSGAVTQDCSYDSIPATAPAERFVDNGDGTVTDRGTGLQWKRCSEGQIWMGTFCDRAPTNMDWKTALQTAKSAVYAGKDDWRMPNVTELASIIEEACESPAIDLSVFPNTSTYWASSYLTSSPKEKGGALISSRWDIHFQDGDIGDHAPYEWYLRLVRGGKSAGALNDTGIDWWSDFWNDHLPSEPADYPGQDATFGRDATDHDDSDGHAGFSFTKLDAYGKPLPASAADWSCVRDEVTGLVWEAKTDDGGLHDRDWFYSWFDPDYTKNYGMPGTEDGTDICYDPTRCDTHKYAADVNAEGLCGRSDWRLPRRTELLSIVDFSTNTPAIDVAYFPNIGPGWWYWSASPRRSQYDSYGGYRWYIDFETGGVDDTSNRSGLHVRLVRGTYLSGDVPSPEHIGVWRPSTRRFLLDINGNVKWDGIAGGDTQTGSFGLATDLPVTGDWNRDGKDEIGVWRPSVGKFLLDANGNDQWDGAAGGDTQTSAFGLATDLPVSGDWNGDGKDEIGVWRPGTRRFMLDRNGNGKWDGPAGGDIQTAAYGLGTDLPVTGDWDDDGKDDVGVWRPSSGRFLLDGNANGKWEGTAKGDILTAAFGAATDLPLSGDWDGDGDSEIGVWRPSTREFMLDANGNGKWDGAPKGDILSKPFGQSTDRPVTGSW